MVSLACLYAEALSSYKEALPLVSPSQTTSELEDGDSGSSDSLTVGKMLRYLSPKLRLERHGIALTFANILLHRRRPPFSSLF